MRSAFLDFEDKNGSFAAHLWSFVKGKPFRTNFASTSRCPPPVPESDALSKDLKKRGFKFRRQYDHLCAHAGNRDGERPPHDCFRYRQCKSLAKRLEDWPAAVGVPQSACDGCVRKRASAVGCRRVRTNPVVPCRRPTATGLLPEAHCERTRSRFFGLLGHEPVHSTASRSVRGKQLV